MITKFASKKFFILAILVLLIFPKISYAVAYPWPDIIGFNYGEMLKEIDRSIYGAIMSALKQAAVETINETVSTMISNGGAGGALFITDWKDELFYTPAKNTRVYMNDWFKTTQRGKGSSANYLAANGGEGVSGSYTKQLEQQARSATIEQKEPPPCEVNDPSSMFSGGNWRQFNLFISNPNCNMGYILRAQEETMNKYNQEQTLAMTKAIAYQGYREQGESGKVITPGSTIKDIQSNVQDLGNKILAGATTIPEVITAVVTKIVTKTIQQGIGNAQRNVQREINNVTSGYTKEFNSTVTNPQDTFKSPF